MNKVTLRTLLFFISAYLLIVVSVYFFQEKLIFHQSKLDSNYKFQFQNKFDEINIKVSNNETLNALLFYAEKPKGVIYFLHGNSGDLSGWGDVAPYFLDNNYDIFIIDYPGFGKSTGGIRNEKQLLADLQIGYDYLMKKYSEDKIVILGYSIGTGPSAYLASINHPKTLILVSPYYSFKKLAKTKAPFIPSFVLKYPLETNKFLKNVTAPIYIFHGNKDGAISIENSRSLIKDLKQLPISFTEIDDVGHNGILKNYYLQQKIDSIL